MKKPEAIQGTCGLWIHGDTGTGKSHSVITQHPDRYIKPLNKWWDGYQNEVVVHLDELAPSHAQWIAPYLKKWADKWPFDAETKGSSIQIRPELVVVTSNYALCDMGFSQEDLPALERRFRVVEKKETKTFMSLNKKKLTAPKSLHRRKEVSCERDRCPRVRVSPPNDVTPPRVRALGLGPRVRVRVSPPTPPAHPSQPSQATQYKRGIFLSLVLPKEENPTHGSIPKLRIYHQQLE